MSYSSRRNESEIFDSIGREAGCLALSKAFYSRVALDPNLKPLFPGKSLRCATEEFSAFLVQFFNGDESCSQYRWWLSLRESHARFQITESHRRAWTHQMDAAMQEIISSDDDRNALRDFFVKASLYLLDQDVGMPSHSELATLWRRQLSLEEIVKLLASGSDSRAIEVAEEFSEQKSVFVGILAKMMGVDREDLIAFTVASIDRDPDLSRHLFNGRTLLHFAAGFGRLKVVQKLLSLGADPNALDSGGHAPLYRAASGASGEKEAIVHQLVRAGALVNHSGGVNGSTALHEAARHGNLPVTRALLAAGANLTAKDKKGLTPVERATNCRRHDVAAFLSSMSR